MIRFKTVTNHILVLIFIILCSCSTTNSPINDHPQIQELVLQNVEMQEIFAPNSAEESYFQLEFTYLRKAKKATFYYQQYSGIMKHNNDSEKCKIVLHKKKSELPRSIYPLLTKGYIVVQFTWFGMETYEVIKNFKMLVSVIQK